MTLMREQLINARVQAWEEQQAVREREDKQRTFWPVITISREFGARGAALARILAERTGFEVWDKDLIRAVANERGGDKRMLKMLDEQAGGESER